MKKFISIINKILLVQLVVKMKSNQIKMYKAQLILNKVQRKRKEYLGLFLMERK